MCVEPNSTLPLAQHALEESQGGKMFLEGDPWKFHKHIGKVAGRCDAMDFYVTFLYLFVDIVVVYINMLDFVIVFCVLC